MEILEHIWSDTFELREGADLPPLAAILSSLLAAPMICFSTKMGGKAALPIVSLAGSEVMPGASLADVLFEEFSIEVSDATVVLIEPESMSQAHSSSSQDLGQALGQILVDLAGLNQNDNLAPAANEPSTIAQPMPQIAQIGERRAAVNLVQ